MIAYDLHCSAAHVFEGWFSSSTDFDDQKSAGLLRCPICDDDKITKSLSAPNIGRKGNQSRIEQPVLPNAEPEIVPAAKTDGNDGGANDIANGGGMPANIPSPQMTAEPKEMAALMGKLAEAQKEVLKDSKWVGRKFAEEARAIHYGETENRQIHGETSPKEAKELSEEGISIAALPLPIIPPEAKN